MDALVTLDGTLLWGGARYRCALGRGGLVEDKREGDGATPIGRFALRRVMYRPDRMASPETRLPVSALAPTDGWCDDPDDPEYNRHVRLPHPARCETLWRQDGIYDLIVTIGHNDNPTIPGHGSAIFIHIARPGYGPTEGCVALSRADLLGLLRDWSAAVGIRVEGGCA